MEYNVTDCKNHRYFTDCWRKKKYYQLNLHNIFLSIRVFISFLLNELFRSYLDIDYYNIELLGFS